ncbi:hypothetical protein Sango_0439100 [Sesamum angolense]|uniref:Uncharacterized protein n=1 Tax=Sesamum angolense TaxID=2727404 RepID=A0AAE1XB15_9LAMI|nr:hypothetical protein Sango_0439100 [Sesamum angolense]
MPQAPTVRSSAYLNALTLEIEKKLQRALASATQRPNLLQELFADIALEVDDRAKQIIFGEEDAISVADDGYSGPICFYSVLADYFVCMPQNGKSILDLIVQLWSQSFASNTFALLFHKWMFEVQLDNPEVSLRYSSALVQGAANVFCVSVNPDYQGRGKGDLTIRNFRIDIQTNATRFLRLFQYLLDEVALDSERLKKIPQQAQRDLFLLLSRFIFFYNSADKLESFLKQFPDFPNAFLIGSAADIFVIELADQARKTQWEELTVTKFLSSLESGLCPVHDGLASESLPTWSKALSSVLCVAISIFGSQTTTGLDSSATVVRGCGCDSSGGRGYGLVVGEELASKVEGGASTSSLPFSDKSAPRPRT